MQGHGLLKGGPYMCTLHSAPIKNLNGFWGIRVFKPRRRLVNFLDKFTADVGKKLTTSCEKSRSCEQMPSHNTEEAALLGMPGVVQLDMDDIEMKNVQLQCAMTRRFSCESAAAEVRVRTDRGELLVAVKGDRAKPAIFTYHDIGVNYTCFQSFFNYVDMRALLQNFCVYHINAPGQEEGAANLPEDYVYPTMEELANQLNYVLGHFGIRSFIGFGVGAGANILTRFALAHPQKVDALAVVNCSASQAGWIEWAYQKMDTRSLRNHGMTQNVLDNLMWHHFGREPDVHAYDLVQLYRSYFNSINPYNLSLFMAQYTARGEIPIARDANTLQVPVLNMTGAQSPHQQATVSFNSRLNPHNSSWLKISDCAMVEEQPGKVAEAFRLFLQGEGYAVLALQKVVRRCSSPSSTL